MSASRRTRSARSIRAPFRADSATWEARVASNRSWRPIACKPRSCSASSEHDVAAGIVITSEAGCEFGNLAGEHLTASEMIRRTPIRTPTFVAAPKRLAALQALARALPVQ